MPRIDHVVCPVDFTPASTRALTYAAAWARWYEARLHVIHVAPLQMVSAPLAGVAVMLQSPSLADVRQKVTDLAASVDLTGIEVDIEVLEGDPPAQIRTALARLPHALVILGSHDRTQLERFVLGSVAQRVVAGTPKLILTFWTAPSGWKRTFFRIADWPNFGSDAIGSPSGMEAAALKCASIARRWFSGSVG